MVPPRCERAESSSAEGGGGKDVFSPQVFPIPQEQERGGSDTSLPAMFRILQLATNVVSVDQLCWSGKDLREAAGSRTLFTKGEASSGEWAQSGCRQLHGEDALFSRRSGMLSTP